MQVHQPQHVCYPGRDANNDGDCAWGAGAEGGIWELSVPSIQFCYKPKTIEK